ncbi:DUF2281 domain-containing protein [Crocosphaera watsonii]|uniref:DUF2281 domain-containing protein n=1 Tax=Crocosphaera watsonii WH 8501 TaxID=165597 RepID=Q4BVN0_CROWT|nr:DUF2281 domain-containing protein [Crocosphaera watsonii]EAM47960.1 hypothetical protein CwatDRAFT_0323 [Crocosphaera watsonii WH 8501]
MNIEQTVMEYLRELPPDKQQEVLDFTQFLNQKMSLPKPDPNLTPEQKSANWLAWIDSHQSSNPPLTDESLEKFVEKSAEQNQQLTPEERTQNWLAFVETLPKQSANLPDEALHRDTMYD